MATVTALTSLLRPHDPRWMQINREQKAEDDMRARSATVVERLDRGLRLSRAAAELRRAAWEAQHGRPAT
jgi:hypothetical protein